MANKTHPQRKVRVQVDLNAAEANLLELLQHRLSVRSRADMLQQAYSTFLWIVDELLSGRRIISVEPEVVHQLPRYKELTVPAVEPAIFGHYRYLIKRPEKGREQPYLRGRNMTVGQLIYKMRANNLSASEAAEDMDLPIQQVLEAQAYYQIHQELIASEMAEDGIFLEDRGVQLESGTVSG